MTGARLAQISWPRAFILALAACPAVLSARIDLHTHDVEMQKGNQTFLPLILPLFDSVRPRYHAQLEAPMAPKKLSYIRLPKADACMVDPDATMTFFSAATNRSSDPRTCSMCRSIVTSLSEHEEEFNFLSFFSSGKHVKRDRLACQGVSEWVPELQSDCRKLARSFFSQVKDFYEKVRDLASATELGSSFAASAACEDLQCCPQDPFVAEVVAGVASESVKRPADVKTIEKFGIVGGLLGSRDIRSKLEEHLRYLNIRKHTVDGEDFVAQCHWDYRTFQCEPSDVCHYLYKFGDLQLSHSCRLKPGFLQPPTSDSDCKWDYAGNACHQPEYCGRHCKATDTSLSDCCRRRESESEAEEAEEGNCAGQEDLAVMAKPTIHAAMEKIQNETFMIFRQDIDAEKSLSEHVALGLSEKCAACFVDFSKCTVTNCLTQFVENVASEAAVSCLAAHCRPPLVSCAGVEELYLPTRQSPRDTLERSASAPF